MSDIAPRLDDENFERLTEHIQSQLVKLEELPYPKVQQDVFELLNCMDLMHREVFSRLLELIETQAPQIKLDIANDFAMQYVMMLYGFVPESPAPNAENKANGVNGNHNGLHIADTGATKTGGRAGQSVTIALDAIPIKAPPPMTMPMWMPLGDLADMGDGDVRGQKVADRNLVICRVGNEIFALDNHGLDSILPLDRGTLDGYILRDPWHDASYDIRTGVLTSNSNYAIETYPVVVSKDGKYRVGFNISKKAAAFLAQARGGA